LFDSPPNQKNQQINDSSGSLASVAICSLSSPEDSDSQLFQALFSVHVVEVLPIQELALERLDNGTDIPLGPMFIVQ